MPTQTQPKIFDLRREFASNQTIENAISLVSESLKIRREFDTAMEIQNFTEAVSIGISLAIATNESRDSDRLEQALNALRLADFATFNNIFKSHEDVWAIALELGSDKAVKVSLEILKEIEKFWSMQKKLRDECANRNDILGLIDIFKLESYSHPVLPLWNREIDAKLIIRENSRLVNNGVGKPTGLGWWTVSSRMFHELPVGTVVDCPPPLTELFRANFPSLIFTQDYSDREFTHEADPFILPSIFGCLPKEKYLNYPELKPIKGKVGFALGDRKRINGQDVIENLPLDFDEIVDLENEDLIKKGFLATAEEIASCDFVIGADCPVIHLAGGMGVPSAIVLTKYHDARFGMAESGDRVSWYDSQKIIMAAN